MLTGMGWGLTSLINASKILPTIIKQFSSFAKLLQTGVIEIPKAIAKVGGLTAAMAKLQAVSLPIIAILTAVATVIGLIIEKAIKNKEAIDEMSSSAIKFKESIDDLNKSTTEEKAKIDATASSVDVYLKRIEELDKKLVLNNSEQAEYHSLLQKIVEVMPSVASSIDLQNDKIIGGTTAIYDQIEAWKKLGEQQAYQATMTDLYKNKADMEFQLAEQRIKLAQKEAEYSNLPATDVAIYGFWTQWTDPNEKKRKNLAQDITNTQAAIANLEFQLQNAESQITNAEEALRSMLDIPSTNSSEYGNRFGTRRNRTPTGMGNIIGVTKDSNSADGVLKLLDEENSTTTSNTISSIEESMENIEDKAEKLKFSIQEYTSESESYIDLLESEYDLMNLQGKSEDELISKIKQIQEEYHKEADVLREISKNSETLKLSTEEVYNIETNINQLSINWLKWQEKINTLLEKAKESTEGIKEDVEDVYDKYMKAVEAERQEERERKLKERKEWDTYKYWLEQAYKINSYVEQLKASNEELKKQLELEEKLDKLARAKESRVLVYRNGNYEYIQDVDQVSKAAKDLSAYQEEESLEKKINGLLELASAYQTMAEELASGKLGHSSIVAETIKAVEEQGGWRKVFGAYPEETPKTVEEIEINTREIVNNLALIGKKIKVFPYAGGTTRASGGLSLVGEKGAELRVLNRGDGILPADLTSNLMRWGQFSPNEFKSNSITGFGSNMSVTIQALNLPNVSDGAGFVEYVRTHMFGQVLNLVH